MIPAPNIPCRGPLLLLLVSAACSPPQKVEFGPEGPPAETERPVVWGADHFERYGIQAVGPVQGATDPSVGYSVPVGWQELEPRQFRDVNLLVAGDPDAQCYLTLGVAGGVDDNLNRWRRQMGQPPLSPEELQALPRHPFLGTDAVLMEVDGSFTARDGTSQDGFRLVGLLAPLGGKVTTLKMIGPARLLQDERDAFFELAASISLDGAPTAASSDRPDRGAAMRWQAPSHWQKGPDRPFREVTYRVGQETECYVSVLAGDGGGFRPNFDRWCSQMGRPPLTDEELASLPTVEMLGHQSVMARLAGSFTGMSGEQVEDAAMLVAACFLADRAVFVKMIGPAEEVDANRTEFVKFCSSLEG